MNFFSKLKNRIILVLVVVALAVSLVVSTMSVNVSASGSDVYHKLIHGDTQQSALLLAELGEVEVSMEASSNIKILRCVNGYIDTFSTKLNKIDNINNEYTAGDNVLVSVTKRFFGGYDVALFMKKVSVSEKGVVAFPVEEYTPDLFALEWYVNTGQKDFIFDGNESKTVMNVYVEDSSGESQVSNKKKTDEADIENVGKTLIYSQNKNGKIDVKRIEEPYLSHNNNVLIVEKFYHKHRVLLIVICFVALAALIAFRIWVGSYLKKRTKSNSITEQ